MEKNLKIANGKICVVKNTGMMFHPCILFDLMKFLYFFLFCYGRVSVAEPSCIIIQ